MDVIKGINSIIQVAKECRKIRPLKIRQPKKFRQTLPQPDETLIIPDLPNLQPFLSQRQSPQPSGHIPVPNENRTTEDPRKDYRLKTPPLHTTDQDLTTLSQAVQLVQPTLGMTEEQRQQLQTVDHPLDVQEILGTQTLEGYVQSPVQTLDGIVVNQPHRFLPIAQEAKRLAEQITKDQQAQ